MGEWEIGPEPEQGNLEFKCNGQVVKTVTKQVGEIIDGSSE